MKTEKHESAEMIMLLIYLYMKTFVFAGKKSIYIFFLFLSNYTFYFVLAYRQINNVVVVSSEQCSHTYTCIHTYTFIHSPPVSPLIQAGTPTLRRVPCAIQ